MNIPFNCRNHDNRHFLTIVFTFQFGFQIFNCSLHSFSTRNQLWQKIFLGIEQFTHLINCRYQFFIYNCIRFYPFVKHPFHTFNYFILVSLHYRFIYRRLGNFSRTGSFTGRPVTCRSYLSFCRLCANYRRMLCNLVNISHICFHLIQQKVWCECSIYKHRLWRIGNRHGKSVCNRHRKKCRIHIDSFRQSEGYIGKSAYGCQFQFIFTIWYRIKRFKCCIFIGSYRCNQSVYNDILLRKSHIKCTVHNFVNDTVFFLDTLRQSFIW